MELDNQSTLNNDSRVQVSSAALIGFVYQFITCELGRERSNRAIPTPELLNCVYHTAEQESLKRTLK